MSGLIKLFAGEMKRMVSYKILPVSLATSLIWVVIFALPSSSIVPEIHTLQCSGSSTPHPR